MSWLGRALHRERAEQQLDAELRFDYEQRVAEKVRAGTSESEARRTARLEFGGIEQVKEECRDARGTRWLEELFGDIRYAVRTLRQHPGFAATALLTLAIGTGATTVMFTVVYGVLLKPLPYPEPERLVSMSEQREKYGPVGSFSYLNFLDCQREGHSLTSMAAWRSMRGGTVSEPGEAEHVSSSEVSADLFSVLGTALVQGRAFLPEEDRAGAGPVVIISSRLWQQRFGGSPNAIGRRLVFGGKAWTVVGVAPPGLSSIDPVGEVSGAVDVLMPLGQDTGQVMQNRAIHPGIHVVARLRRGVALTQAQEELNLIGRHLAGQYPKSNAGHDFAVQPLQQRLVGDVRKTLWLLLGAVSLVLLIACVNVASLLLARAVSRERELAMRAALGASKGRLLRQCLTESAVLSFSGGLLGIVLAAIGTKPFLRHWPGDLPRIDEVRFDWRVLLFALTVSLLSGLCFGLAPALRAPARELERALRAGARNVSASAHRLHGSFVVSEIAIAIVLLVSAGLLGRTLLQLASIDPGIDVRNVLIARVALSPSALVSPAKGRATWRDLLDRVSGVPGIQAVAAVDLVPMRGDDDEIGYWTTPAAPTASQIPLALLTVMTPDYLKVMGVPLRRGRFFDDQDRSGNEPVVIIDEVLAKRAFGEHNPVGSRLSLQFLGPARVVGIVGHVRHWGVDADDKAKVREQIYTPFTQLPDALDFSSGMSLVVRTTSAPLSVVEALRREVRGTANDQTLYEVRTMEQLAGSSLSPQRFLLLVFGIFAGLALLLACIGIYGVLSYLTSRRVPEIGLRMALGASAGDVRRLIFRQSAGMILVGVTLGTAGALAASRLLERLVSGARPADPVTFIVMILILIVAALAASFFPARRASQLDPMTALRQE